MQPKGIVHTKIGVHRNRKRLWLEGRKLERAGISPGQKFNLVWNRDENQLVLEFATEGERSVSKRMRRGREMPIIDVSGNIIEDTLGASIDRAEVKIFPGKIVVQLSPHDLLAKERIDRLLKRVKNNEPLQTGSIAHGGGVLDHALHTGLKDEGIRSRLAFAVEIEDNILEASLENNPVWDEETLYVSASMAEINTRDLPKVDILVAGLPCVGASKSGKSKNKLDKAEDHPSAGLLFIPFIQIMNDTNPAIVIFENVPEYMTTFSHDAITNIFGKRGYTFHSTMLEGNAFGALEDRKRLCLVGVSNDLEIRLDSLMPTRNKESTLSEILEDITPDSEEWREYRYIVEKAMRDTAAGKGFKLNLVDGSATKVGTIGAGYHKVRQTEPKVKHPTDPKLMRQLTPKEHASVKTIPPELIENLNATLAHTILGNSVIWSAWRSVGRHLAQQCKKHANVEEIDLTLLKADPQVQQCFSFFAEENDAEIEDVKPVF